MAGFNPLLVTSSFLNDCFDIVHSFCVISTSSSQCTYSSGKIGTEPSRPCRPIDLTPDLYPTFTNRFSVVWGNFGKVCSSGEKYGK